MFQRRFTTGILLASLVAVLCGSAQAQQFTRPNLFDREAADYARHRELLTVATSATGTLGLRKGRTPSGSAADFERYFNIYLERLTLEATLMDLPRIREGVSNDLAILGANQQMHNQMVSYMLTNLEALVRDQKIDALPITIGEVRNNVASTTDGQFPVEPPYHRATRVNAMYLIGELNDEEPESSFGEEGTPLPAAVDTLLAGWSDTDLPIEVRVASVIGLNRHASLGIADNQKREQIRAAMLSLLNEATPPEGRSAGAQLWLRQVAASVLGNLGDLGANQEVLTALLDTVQDSQAPLKLRCGAAAALAPLAYDGNVQLQDVGRALGALAVDAASLETSNRAALRHYLACVESGIGAADDARRIPASSITEAASTEDDQQFVVELARLVEEMADKVEESIKDTPDEEPETLKISQQRKRNIMRAAGDLQAFLRQSVANTGDANGS